MTDIEIQMKLQEMAQNQSRWHDDFKQRETHWLYMRGFWLVSVGVGVGVLITKFL